MKTSERGFLRSDAACRKHIQREPDKRANCHHVRLFNKLAKVYLAVNRGTAFVCFLFGAFKMAVLCRAGTTAAATPLIGPRPGDVSVATAAQGMVARSGAPREVEEQRISYHFPTQNL